jgi:hypothetical protein
MGGSSFDLIAQEMLKQQHRMEELIEENRELQRQLAELRAGRDVFVEINGQQIALNLLIEEAASAIPAESLPQAVTQETNIEEVITPSVIDAPTVVTTALTEPPTDPRIPTLPKAVPVTSRKQEEEEKKKTPSTFLAEMMVDEFSAAMTSPMAVWTGPARQPEITDEEQKAALRKELMGSFLLE